MEDAEEGNGIVIDNGSGFMKAGFVGDDEPQSIFRTVVHTEKQDSFDDDANIKVGEAISNTHQGQLINPIKNGMITSWNGIEAIYNHIFFKNLKIEPEEHPILITECALNKKIDREKMTQFLFETFNVPSMYLAIQGVLALYATGRTSGTMIDSGYEQTQIMLIYEGYSIRDTINKCEYGGKQSTEYLKNVLLKKYENLDKIYNEFKLNEIIRSIKEKHCYVVENKEIFNTQIQKPAVEDLNILISAYLRDIDYKYLNYTSTDIENCCNKYCGDLQQFANTIQKYELPDGKIIKLGIEQFECTEIMFMENIRNEEYNKINALLNKTIQSGYWTIREERLTDVIICGGNSMLKGFKQRMEYELGRVDFRCGGFGQLNFKLIDNAEKQYLTWIGGSILGSLSTFQEMWITKCEYQQDGAGIVHRKCF